MVNGNKSCVFLNFGTRNSALKDVSTAFSQVWIPQSLLGPVPCDGSDVPRRGFLSKVALRKVPDLPHGPQGCALCSADSHPVGADKHPSQLSFALHLGFRVFLSPISLLQNGCTPPAAFTEILSNKPGKQ